MELAGIFIDCRYRYPRGTQARSCTRALLEFGLDMSTGRATLRLTLFLERFLLFRALDDLASLHKEAFAFSHTVHVLLCDIFSIGSFA